MDSLTKIILEAYVALTEEVNPKTANRFVRFFKDKNTGQWYDLNSMRYESIPVGGEPKPGQPVKTESGSVKMVDANGDQQALGAQKYPEYYNYFLQQAQSGAESGEKREDGTEAFPETDLVNEPLDSEATTAAQESLRATEAEVRTRKLENRLGRPVNAAEKRMVAQLYGTGYSNDLVYKGIWSRWQERTGAYAATTQDALDFAEEVVSAYEDLLTLNKELLHGTKQVDSLSSSDKKLLQAFTFRKGELYYRGVTELSFAGEVAGELDHDSRIRRFGLRISKEDTNSALGDLDRLRNIKDSEGEYILPKSSDESIARAKSNAFTANAGLLYEHTLEFLANIQSGKDPVKAVEKLVKSVPKLQEMAMAAEERRVNPLEFTDAFTVGYMEIIKDAEELFNTDSPTAAQTIATFMGQFISRSRTLSNTMPKGLEVKQSGTEGAGFMGNGEIRNSDITIKSSKKLSEFAATLAEKGVGSVRSDIPLEMSLKYNHESSGPQDLGMRDLRPLIERPEKVQKAQNIQAQRLGAALGDDSLAQETADALAKEARETKRILSAVRNTNLGTLKSQMKSRAKEVGYKNAKSLDGLMEAMSEYKSSKDKKRRGLAEQKLLTVFQNYYRNTLPKREQSLLYANHFMTNGMSTSENQILVISHIDEQNYALHEDDLMTGIAGQIVTGEIKLAYTASGVSLRKGGKSIGGVGTRWKDGRGKMGATVDKGYLIQSATKL